MDLDHSGKIEYQEFIDFIWGQDVHVQETMVGSAAAGRNVLRNIADILAERGVSPEDFPGHVALTALRAPNATLRSSLYVKLY